MLGVDIVDVDAQVWIADVVVGERQCGAARGQILHELQREALHAQHRNIDVGTRVVRQRVEPFTLHAAPAEELHTHDVAVEHDRLFEIANGDTHVVE